jgi:mono/diheme cytochrome c family protein
MKLVNLIFILLVSICSSVFADKPLYVVKDGKVDKATEKGFKTWRAASCDRCHGNNQQGMVGPSLIESLKVLTYEEFKTVILVGRNAKGMPAHKHLDKIDNSTGKKKVDLLYAYLKGRSDGKIPKGRVRSFEK